MESPEFLAWKEGRQGFRILRGHGIRMYNSYIYLTLGGLFSEYEGFW